MFLYWDNFSLAVQCSCIGTMFLYWDNISLFKDLSENFIREFHDLVNWDEIFERRYIDKKYGEEDLFSEQFIKEFKSKMNWKHISLSHNLSEDLMRHLKDDMDWDYITKYQMLDEDFIEELQHKVNWKYISKYQIWLSEDFIRKFRDKIDFNSIMPLNYLNEKNIMRYYSLDFIKEFTPYYNEYYKYNMFCRRIQRRWKEIIYKPPTNNTSYINNTSYTSYTSKHGGVGYKRSFDEFQDMCQTMF